MMADAVTVQINSDGNGAAEKDGMENKVNIEDDNTYSNDPAKDGTRNSDTDSADGEKKERNAKKNKSLHDKQEEQSAKKYTASTNEKQQTKKDQQFRKKDYQKKQKDFFPADKGGTFTLCVKKPYPSYTQEEAFHTFSLFGDIAEINFCEINFFVRYYNKTSAVMALHKLKDVMQLAVANVKHPEKNVHSSNLSLLRGGMLAPTKFTDSTPRPTEVFIGNISTSSNKKEFEKVLEGTQFLSLRYHNKNGKGFAFVQFPSLNSAKKAVSLIDGKVLQGRPLSCRLSDNHNTRAKEEGSSMLNHGGIMVSNMPTEDCAEILIKNLHPETTQSHIYTLFSRYGGATYVITNFSNARKCVEAKVGLQSVYFAKTAISELHGQIVDGRMLVVTYNYSIPASAASHKGHHGGGSGHSHGQSHHSSVHSNNSMAGYYGSMTPHLHPAVSKLQQATELACRADALINEVLDDCHYCERIKMLMNELQYALLEAAEEVGQ